MGFFGSFVFSSPISYLYSSGLYDNNSFYNKEFEIIEEELDSFDILNEIIYYETDLYINILNNMGEITNNLNIENEMKEQCNNIIKYITFDTKKKNNDIDISRINNIFNINKNYKKIRKYRNNRNRNKFKK